MFLAVDSGNTRVKWALCDDDGEMMESGAFPAGRIAGLRKIALRASVCRVAHVGGAMRGRRLRAVLSSCADFDFARGEARACGVVSHYNPPESLGADRWLSLLAARALGGGKGGRGWVIVSLGTATTVDGLTADGDFIGGLILPGLSSFPSALADSTALPRPALSDARKMLEGGKNSADNGRELPRSTAAAIGMGALMSTAGAALAYRRRFMRGAEFILTGGDAEHLSACLPSARVIPDLVLRGLIVRYF